jgi:hypothetical protein
MVGFIAFPRFDEEDVTLSSEGTSSSVGFFNSFIFFL